jgi:NifB/MoaA-like Fe-S oxidoreductase
MLKSDEDIFLDDITVTDVERELGVKVLVVENSGQAFVSALMK